MVERIGKVGHCTSLVWRSTVTSKMSTGKQQQGKEGTSKGLISLSPIMVLQFPKHGGWSLQPQFLISELNVLNQVSCKGGQSCGNLSHRPPICFGHLAEQQNRSSFCYI
jgi:hypothetical protein